MHNERNGLSDFASLNIVDFMQMNMSPERMSPRPPGTSEALHADGVGPGAELVFAGATERTEARLEAALQALRDVRHLLPAQGVAIVDAVLDRSVD